MLLNFNAHDINQYITLQIKKMYSNSIVIFLIMKEYINANTLYASINFDVLTRHSRLLLPWR